MGKASRARKTRVSPQGQLDAMTRSRRVASVESRAAAEAADRVQVVNQLQRIPARQAALDARKRELVDQARELGVEWTVIGAALLVTPQAVAKRFGGSPADKRD